MEALFLKIVNMSLTASWMILAVFLLRIVLKKAPAWMNCMLWGLVGFRLVCPFRIKSALSLIPASLSRTILFIHLNRRFKAVSLHSMGL